MKEPTRVIHRWFGSESKGNRRGSQIWRYEYKDGAVELIPYFDGCFHRGRPLPTPHGGIRLGAGISLWREAGKPWRESRHRSQHRLVSCAANSESLAEAVACLSLNGHQACR